MLWEAERGQEGGGDTEEECNMKTQEDKRAAQPPS